MSKESYTTLVAINIYFYPEKTKLSFRNVGLQVADQSFPPSPPQNVLQQFEQGRQNIFLPSHRWISPLFETISQLFVGERFELIKDLVIQQAAMQQYQQSVQEQAQMSSFMHNLSMKISQGFPGNQKCQCGAGKTIFGECPNCNRRY